MPKLTNVQKRLKLASMLIERAEIELNKAIFLAKDEPIPVTMDLEIKLERLTELKDSIWK